MRSDASLFLASDPLSADQHPLLATKATNSLLQEIQRPNIWFATSAPADDLSSVLRDKQRLDPLDLYCSDTPPSYYVPKLRALSK